MIISGFARGWRSCSCRKRQETQMFNRFCFGALLLASLSLTFTGCNATSGLDSIQVTPATNSIAVGSTVQLTATGTYGNAAHSSTGSVAGATWTSANTSVARSEEHTSELQSRQYLVCR